MTLQSREEIRKLTEKLVELSAADEIEVSASGGETTHLRFARNTPSTSGTFRGTTVTVKSTIGRRSGSVSLNQFDGDSLESAVRRSEEIARLSPEDPEHMPALGPQTHLEVKAYSEETARSGPAALPDGAARCIGDAMKRGLTAAGYMEVSAGFTALASSSGLFAHHAATSTFFAETVRTADGRGSGWAGMSGNRMDEIDFGRVSAVAIDKAVASADPKPLDPGKYVTVLEPACVAPLISRMVRSMDARSADEGRSFFAAAGDGTRMGEKLFPESVTIYSDPSDPLAPARPWGEDGLPQARRTWIDRGQVATLSYSRYWAAQKGVEPVPMATNFLMRGGDASVEDLIRSVERGVLVTSLWYIRDVDPRTLLLTGLTRDGVFWIEGGKVVRPVQNFRWNDSPISVLRNVEAMSRPQRAAPRGRPVNHIHVPALKLKEFNFASVSDAV
jgi:predicted Zn-dependent protease